MAELRSADRSPLRFALLGAGFWARYQLAAWREVEGVKCVAVFNRTREKAERLARDFGVPRASDNAEELLTSEPLDFVDIVTDVGTHSQFVHLAAKHRLPAICQKPLAPSLAAAEAMTETCKAAGVPLLVHENFRWQRPIRELKRVLTEGAIGRPFRARIDMISGFPVFRNQPFLRVLDVFILTDLGTHILDVARFLFGEAESLYCQTQRVHRDIRGEDMATTITRHPRGPTTVVCNLAYAENYLERECFPQTLIFIEGTTGSLELGPDYWMHLTTAAGTERRRYEPTLYSWLDPAYAVVQSSIVDCHRDLARALGDPSHAAETTADDNLRTLRLVYGAYQSAADKKVISYDGLSNYI
jgi:predicted dehydrogenase